MILTDRKKLGRLMVVQGISQRQLAARAGFQTHSYIGALVRGSKRTLTAERAVAIAKVLGVGTDDLFRTEVTSKPVQPDHHNGTRAA